MKNLSLQVQTLIALAVTLIIVAVSCFYYFGGKRPKGDLSTYYRVSKPTLLKWAQFFSKNINMEEWKKKRKLSYYEMESLKNEWGNNSNMVLNKAAIVEISGSDYKTVAENVKKNLNKIGISIEAWESCSVFPPNISKCILDVLG